MRLATIAWDSPRFFERAEDVPSEHLLDLFVRIVVLDEPTDDVVSRLGEFDAVELHEHLEQRDMDVIEDVRTERDVVDTDAIDDVLDVGEVSRREDTDNTAGVGDGLYLHPVGPTPAPLARTCVSKMGLSLTSQTSSVVWGLEWSY